MRRLFLLCLFFLAACSPSQPTLHEVDLPTIVPLPTAEMDLEESLRTAMAFLGAWQAQDFATMYSLLSFSSQETISPDAFRAAYEDAQNTMTFNAFDFEGRAVGRLEGLQAAQLTYDITFHTNLLGDISDTNRTLTIILDPSNQQWRVAWSLGDIFAEFAIGGRLDFQSSPPSRANIYDRNGTILADMQGRMVAVLVVRQDAPDWDICRNTLSEILALPIERIDAIYSAARLDWAMRVGLIESSVYLDTLQKGRLETDCQATFEGVPTRQYLPNGSVLPHVLGFVGFPSPEQVDDLVRAGFNSETIIGQAGVEATWNDVLMGRPGGRLLLLNADGSRSRLLAEVSPQISESIWLTIDLGLQQFVNSALNTAFAQNGLRADGGAGWGATSPGASAIVMNVNTGEILALASFPNFDSNAFTPYPEIGRAIAQEMQAAIAADERRPMLNRVTQGGYPAGSIFKVIDAAAVLDTNVYTIDTATFCTGTWTYEGDTRFDWWPDGHGRMTVQSALMNSCNPFFYQTGFILNQADPFYLPNYARKMGLGNFTGLQDIPEIAGQIPDPDLVRQLYGTEWTYSNAVNLAIGQGELAVTPLQMARLYAGIANGGDLMQPHLVLERGILDQRTIVSQPVVMSRFDFANTDYVMTAIRGGLCDVVTGSSGTAAHIFRNSLLISTVGVCGKTGTAQTPNGLPHSWFAAYAPADEPEIVVVVMVENAGDGSEIAAPITRDILEYYYFGQDQ